MKVPNVFIWLSVALALGGCGGSFLGKPETATSLNGFRSAHGLSELRTDAALTAMASGHSADMARRDNLNHDGFQQTRGPGGARAENVAYGCKETACVINQWANSSGHRSNMLIPSLKRYGLASATSSSGKKYWTLLLGE